MLMAFWEVQRLTREIHHLEYQALTVRHKLARYQKYAGMLGSSNYMTVANISGLPSELRCRATIFAQYANQASTMSAVQNLQMAKMYGMVPMTGNALTQYQLEMSAFARFKQESMKALKEQEVAVLNEMEAEIQSELNAIETSLTIKRESLKSCKELLREEAQNAAPKFGLS